MKQKQLTILVKYKGQALFTTMLVGNSILDVFAQFHSKLKKYLYENDDFKSDFSSIEKNDSEAMAKDVKLTILSVQNFDDTDNDKPQDDFGLNYRLN